ncbi:MAG: flagellar basal body rod protein FlgB [Deltaproteobacteria bacterium]|nr:flagellar basal body rod protein FlgB [Candidatus Anaeroferrophillus wilburensis]MBN2888480.1 flagellar basal body rod protein FlgB [Deltaproteobacteria bacterium]
MTVHGLFDNTTNLLAKVMALRSRKAEVIAGNIANIDTPGYKARNFTFIDQLQKALGEETSLPLMRTHEHHLPDRQSISEIQPVVEEREASLAGFDRNTVDLDHEMAELAENNLVYGAAVEMLRKKISVLKNAIVEGGK